MFLPLRLLDDSGRLRKNSEELEVLKRSLRAIRQKTNQRPEPLIEANQRPRKQTSIPLQTTNQIGPFKGI